MGLGAWFRCLFLGKSKVLYGGLEREGIAIAGRRNRSGIWRIKEKQASGFFRKFRFIAEAVENADVFRLECSWAEFTYLLDVTKNDESIPIFVHIFFSDTKDTQMEDFVIQIMRIAHRDIENKLIRVEQLRTCLFGKG